MLTIIDQRGTTLKYSREFNAALITAMAIKLGVSDDEFAEMVSKLAIILDEQRNCYYTLIFNGTDYVKVMVSYDDVFKVMSCSAGAIEKLRSKEQSGFKSIW